MKKVGIEGKITVLPGDGVGPEIVAEAVKVLETLANKFNHKFKLTYADIGGISIDRHGTAISGKALNSCRESDAILLGSVGGPKWEDPKNQVRPESAVLTLRREFGLFGNIRPVKLFPALVNATSLKPEVVQGLDLIVVRENTGGAYYGQPKKQWVDLEGRHAVDTILYSENEIERVIRLGFELARRRRKKLSSVEKSNVLQTSSLWRQICIELEEGYPDVEVEHVYADACSMWLIQHPTSFDVLVMANLFGDIISDETSALGGSLGMMPSGSIAGLPSDKKGVFGLYESAHGSVPKHAGKNIINPIAEILSVALMLQYSFLLEEETKAIYDAVERVLENYRTYDIIEQGKKRVSTSDMGDLIAGSIADLNI